MEYASKTDWRYGIRRGIVPGTWFVTFFGRDIVQGTSIAIVRGDTAEMALAELDRRVAA